MGTTEEAVKGVLWLLLIAGVLGLVEPRAGWAFLLFLSVSFLWQLTLTGGSVLYSP